MKLLIPGEEYHLAKGEIALINSDILHYAIGDPFCELHSAVFSHVLVSGGNTTAFYKKYVYPLLAFPGFTVWRTGRQNWPKTFRLLFPRWKRMPSPASLRSGSGFPEFC